MVLILGGFAAGKRSAARALGYTDADMSPDVDSDRPAAFDAVDQAGIERILAETFGG